MPDEVWPEDLVAEFAARTVGLPGDEADPPGFVIAHPGSIADSPWPDDLLDEATE